MAQPHDVFLDRLDAAFTIRLVARLNSPELVGNSDEKYLHVFVPDMHLLSNAQRQLYAYGFNGQDQNGNDLFEALTTAILETRQSLRQANHDMTVTQIGDFVDLWRESGNDHRATSDILESFPDIRDRFLPRPSQFRDKVGPNLLLGNHDLEVREARGFGRARLVHYLPGTGRTLVAMHGDTFDFWELVIPDDLAAFVLRALGGLVQPMDYPMAPLRELRDNTTAPPDQQTARIQGDATLAELHDIHTPLETHINVIDVHDPNDRSAAHQLLPNAVKTVLKLRTERKDDGRRFAPNLKVIVIGHSHHARIVTDHTDHIVVLDCGAWIENYRVGQGPPQPNRQLGVVCGSDLRIYQLDP